MQIIGWPVGVNRRILDSTSIVVGDKGYVEDSGDQASFTERRLVSLYAPDTYNVSMDFNWEDKDENGESELDRFVKWYKFRHKRGVNPFEFPSISKFNSFGATKTCYYTITGPLQLQKSGYCMRVTMAWKEFYSGVIEIPDKVIRPISTQLSVGQVYCKLNVSFDGSFDESPLLNAYSIFISKETLEENPTTIHYIDVEKEYLLAYGNDLSYKFTKPTKKGTYYYIFGNLKSDVDPTKTEYLISDIQILATQTSQSGSFRVI
ncbi:MAG: hypothetical protein KBT03_02380 [Bacteroidales bacterium]|nr:hypothetical protein [Candidatus Scybalousia scybalohippi]